MSEELQEAGLEPEVPFAAASNDAVSDDVVPFIEKIEETQTRIDKVVADAVEKCIPLRDEIKEIKLDCHEATNVARVAINHVVSKRRNDLRIHVKESAMAADHLKIALEIYAAMPGADGHDDNPF